LVCCCSKKNLATLLFARIPCGVFILSSGSLLRFDKLHPFIQIWFNAVSHHSLHTLCLYIHVWWRLKRTNSEPSSTFDYSCSPSWVNVVILKLFHRKKINV
jgi:hypothetical protein